MKTKTQIQKIIILLFLIFFKNAIYGQSKSYIQVSGEPNLSIYLNNVYKGKTTVELNGYIIENVTPGKNTIKIIKEGFTPYEEIIEVKNGEVFAYKVKPFAKHKVFVSEQGNSDETDKKTKIETGTLIVQSLPIEIKITIPDVEGIENSEKKKDKWQANNLPIGSYSISFIYNQKTITKTIEIRSKDTVNVFANMLNDHFEINNTLDKKLEKERLEKLKSSIIENYIDSLCKTYKFKLGLTEREFRIYNPEANLFMTSEKYIKESYTRPTLACKYSKPWNAKTKLKDEVTGPSYVSIDKNGILDDYSFDVICQKKDNAIEALEYYKLVKQHIEKIFPQEFLYKSNSSIYIWYPKGKIGIDISYYNYGTTGSVAIIFRSL